VVASVSETATVTLLFCDMVGSTELLTSLGDDANDEVRRALSSTLDRVAHEHRGTVVKHMGDGVMVAFRASAADAVACAIAMQRAAVAIERDGVPLGLELRVGISSGEAAYENEDWFGTPVVEASRLEHAAQAGQILVSEVVRSIVGTRGSAEFRPAGTRELKGFAHPVPVVEVLWRDESTPLPIKRKKARPKRGRLLAGGIALIVVAGAAVSATVVFMLRDSGQAEETGAALVAEGYTPVLQPRDCPEGLSSDPNVRCEFLVVPEDREKPAGRQIKIGVTIYPAKRQAAGVPTITLGGFPDSFDGSNVGDYGDLISFDIRGAQTLTCPEVNAVHLDFSSLRISSLELNELYLDASEQCGQRLASEGFDLDQFGLNDMADDVRDLAIVMGWRQVNIQGAHTWSRIAVFATRYPGFVRSVVIADPYPRFAEQNTLITNYNSSLQAYFAACHADAACERAFPDLEQLLLAAYARYDQEPAVVMTADPDGGPDFRVVVDGDALVIAGIQALGYQSALGLIASTLASLETGGLETTAAFLVENGRRRDFPWGMWNSTFCEDVDPLMSRSTVAAMATAYPLLSGYAHAVLLELCDHWPTNADSALDVEAKDSAVPALLLAGALSPDYGPANAREAAKSFKNATIAVFPNLTTGVLQGGPPCISALRLAFLRDPGGELDIDGCIAQVPPIAFEGTDRSGSTPAGPTSNAP